MKIIAWNVAKTKKAKLVGEKIVKMKPELAFVSEAANNAEEYIVNCGGYNCINPDVKNSSDNKIIPLCIEGCKAERINCIGTDVEENSIYPNLECMKLNTLKILGVRFMNYQMDESLNRKTQIDNFFKIVENIEPSVVIGDFNIDSVISYRENGKLTFSWSRFIHEMSDRDYTYIDARNGDASFSYQRTLELRAKKIGTCPDAVFVKKELVKTVQSCTYHWEENWPSDHSMIILNILEDM